MRYSSLDMVRGFAILAMLFVNILTVLAADLPLILQHNNPMMLPADLIAPLFQFILGVSLVISVSRRRARGEKVRGRVLKRAVTLLLLGFMLTASLRGFRETDWGILQSLGTGLLIGYLMLFLPALRRAVAAGVILAVYSLLFAFVPEFFEYVLTQTHGGLLGTVSYGMVTVFGTIAGEWFYLRKGSARNGIWAGAGLIALSLIANIFVPFNKLAVSASYVLFSSGFFFILLALFYVLGELRGREVRILSLFGRNALALWVAQYLVYLPVIYLAGGCCFFQTYIALAATVLILPLFYVLADILDWKGIRSPI